MLDKKVAELINTQVNKEFYSAYLYLDFANYYKDAELNGFSNWYQVQARRNVTTPCCSSSTCRTTERK